MPVAFKKVHEILIENVGVEPEDLKMEPLTPFGGFSVINALRTVPPGVKRSVIVQFEPLA